MKNYSRQREAVLKVLCATKTHPTAGWIYENVRQIIPNISLGTVYRNLTALEQEGLIKKISVGDTCEHFDGDTSMHSHFLCRCCERIIDIPFDTTEACKIVEAENGVSVETAEYTFVGICKNCL